jgi:hypothetical protein
MTGSIGSRLREPGYVRTLIAFRDLHGLTLAQLVTLCGRSSVAVRLGQPEFDAAMKALRVEYSMSTQQLVTFMVDGVSARLGEPEFDGAVRVM